MREITCDRPGCPARAIYREAVRLSTGGLAFYYYCAEHKPSPVKTAGYETASITELLPGDVEKRQEP